MDTAQKIKKLRKEVTGFTQQKAADILNINIRRYQSYEDGRAKPPFTIAIEMAKLFQVDVHYLLANGSPQISDGGKEILWHQFSMASPGMQQAVKKILDIKDL